MRRRNNDRNEKYRNDNNDDYHSNRRDDRNRQSSSYDNDRRNRDDHRRTNNNESNNNYDDRRHDNRGRHDNYNDDRGDRRMDRDNNNDNNRRGSDNSQGSSRSYGNNNDHNNDRHRRIDNSNSQRRQGGNDYSNRRPPSNNNHNINKNHGSMPPPASRGPGTPSTHASTLSSSTASRSRRGDGRGDAPTPILSRPSSAQRSNNNSNNSNSNNGRRNDTGNRMASSSNARSRSDWDAETPIQGPRDGDSSPIQPIGGEDEYDSDFDREFYDDEEDGRYVIDQSAVDGGQEMGRFLFENSKTKAREADMEKRRRQQGPMNSHTQQQQQQPRSERFNAKKSALQADQEAWEESRLLSSGAAVRSSIDLDSEALNNEKDMSRVTLLVHQVKPPFLSDGRVSFSTVREAVPTVKDASSDFAKMSREGSATLRYIRANKDKNAMRQKFWELGGTKMGNAMGVKKTKKVGDDGEGNNDDEDENGEIDYKKSSGFAQHVKKKANGEDDNTKVSTFAKTKTIREQREFLPVFSVRDELLNVIRENSCVVIVGETGSGKVSLVL